MEWEDKREGIMSGYRTTERLFSPSSLEYLGATLPHRGPDGEPGVVEQGAD